MSFWKRLFGMAPGKVRAELPSPEKFKKDVQKRIRALPVTAGIAVGVRVAQRLTNTCKPFRDNASFKSGIEKAAIRAGSFRGKQSDDNVASFTALLNSYPSPISNYVGLVITSLHALGGMTEPVKTRQFVCQVICASYDLIVYHVSEQARELIRLHDDIGAVKAATAGQAVLQGFYERFVFDCDAIMAICREKNLSDESLISEDWMPGLWPDTAT